jgi:tetrahydrodipicolinate N-succinyltransferase
VLMGTNSCTIPGVSVGDGATIAPGTPVFINVKAGDTLSPFGFLNK